LLWDVPYGRGRDINESGGVTEVACDGFGGGREGHLEGRVGEDIIIEILSRGF